MRTPNYVSKPLAAFKYRVSGGAKVVALYSDLAAAQRAGILRDFRYGTEYDGAPITWYLEPVGHSSSRFEAKNLAGVRRELASLLDACRVQTIEVGGSWCGYPAMTVRYQDGTISTDSYNGAERVETLVGITRRPTNPALVHGFGPLATF